MHRKTAVVYITTAFYISVVKIEKFRKVCYGSFKK